MKITYPLILLISSYLIIAPSNTKNYEKYEDLIMLSNENSELGILTSSGGRIVIYKRSDGDNILKSDSELWDDEFEEPIEDRLDMTIIPFNGHITWIGPQNEWWSHQDAEPRLKKIKSNWPPDPFLIYADCEVIEKSDSRIVLKNPDSPFSGISITKTITLLDNGDVELTSELTNIRDTTIAWDIWFNTRLDGEDRFFIKVDGNENIRLEESENAEFKILDTIMYKYLTFDLVDDNEVDAIYSTKAFIHPADDKLYAFSGNNLFTIKFKVHEKDAIHPDQALIEIYNRVKPDDDDLLELEYHSPYMRIKPGESITATEYWSLEEYNGSNDPEEQIKFIKKMNSQ